jgi:hypothetical protein
VAYNLLQQLGRCCFTSSARSHTDILLLLQDPALAGVVAMTAGNDQHSDQQLPALPLLIQDCEAAMHWCVWPGTRVS